MLSRSAVRLAKVKPITQGYIAQLPGIPLCSNRVAYRRAVEANQLVQEHYDGMTEERYAEWFQRTYGVEDVSECPTVGPSSLHLDDTVALQELDRFDAKGTLEEFRHWTRSFQQL